MGSHQGYVRPGTASEVARAMRIVATSADRIRFAVFEPIVSKLPPSFVRSSHGATSLGGVEPKFRHGPSMQAHFNATHLANFGPRERLYASLSKGGEIHEMGAKIHI